MGLLTGLAIGSLVGNAVLQGVGAHKAAGAARDAAKMQTDAADKATRINDNVYGPYLRQGRSAASTMSRLTTPSAGARYASPDMTQPPPAPSGPPQAAPRPAPRGTLGSIAQAGAAMAAQYGPKPPQPPQSGGGQMVMMEAPDGSGTRPVPADQVDRMLQAGARRVS